MVTDLPDAHIRTINDLLQQIGYNAVVLETEGDDSVGYLAGRYYAFCRKSIDNLTRKLDVRAKIYLCFILDAEKTSKPAPSDLVKASTAWQFGLQHHHVRLPPSLS